MGVHANGAKVLFFILEKKKARLGLGLIKVNPKKSPVVQNITLKSLLICRTTTTTTTKSMSLRQFMFLPFFL